MAVPLQAAKRAFLCRTIDYYGVTFDHLVPVDDLDPEVLQINIIEVDDDGGAYANESLPFSVDPVEYTGKKVLAVPRCCQKRKGTQDRSRINDSVNERDREAREKGQGACVGTQASTGKS